MFSLLMEFKMYIIKMIYVHNSILIPHICYEQKTIFKKCFKYIIFRSKQSIKNHYIYRYTL